MYTMCLNNLAIIWRLFGDFGDYLAFMQSGTNGIRIEHKKSIKGNVYEF